MLKSIEIFAWVTFGKLKKKHRLTKHRNRKKVQKEKG